MKTYLIIKYLSQYTEMNIKRRLHAALSVTGLAYSACAGRNIRDGGAGGATGAVAPHFFPNVMLKQLRFKRLVVQFPREAYKMLYFYLKPPHS